jgi:hypothetical protein
MREEATVARYRRRGGVENPRAKMRISVDR